MKVAYISSHPISKGATEKIIDQIKNWQRILIIWIIIQFFKLQKLLCLCSRRMEIKIFIEDLLF